MNRTTGEPALTISVVVPAGSTPAVIGDLLSFAPHLKTSGSSRSAANHRSYGRVPQP